MVMASRSSERQMNSSAVWERELWPGPIFMEGKGMRAWSESVGLPKGVSPRALARPTSGWAGSIRDEPRRVERGWTSEVRWLRRASRISWLVYDVVLCAGVDDGGGHAHGPEEVRLARELVVAQPRDVVDGVEYGVVALLACCVACASVGSAVEHHESLLGHCGLHPGGLSDEGHVDVWQQWQCSLYAVAAGDFLLGRGEPYYIICLRARCELAECGEQRDERRSVVVGAEAVEAVALYGGREGVACPRCRRADGVYVCVEQQCGPCGVVGGVYGPDVVGLAVVGDVGVGEVALEDVSCLAFAAACARRGDEGFE